MLDDPDVQAVLAEMEEDTTGGDRDRTDEEKEETAFKQDISQLRKTIDESGCRTLGEYLASLKPSQSKRNRQRDGGHLRTDRQMYQEELDAIWEEQKKAPHSIDGHSKGTNRADHFPSAPAQAPGRPSGEVLPGAPMPAREDCPFGISEVPLPPGHQQPSIFLIPIQKPGVRLVKKAARR